MAQNFYAVSINDKCQIHVTTLPTEVAAIYDEIVGYSGYGIFVRQNNGPQVVIPFSNIIGHNDAADSKALYAKLCAEIIACKNILPEEIEEEICKDWANDYCAVGGDLTLNFAGIIANAPNLPNGNPPTSIKCATVAVAPIDSMSRGKKSTTEFAEVTNCGGVVSLSLGGAQQPYPQVDSDFKIDIKEGTLIRLNITFC